MKLIVQEDPYGCGAACLASVLSISYKQALKLFKDGERKAKNAGFFCDEFVEALAKRGLKYERKYIKSRIRPRIYKNGTIVFVRRSKRYPVGHFLSRIDSKWMDPWINFPSLDKKAGLRKRLPERPIYAVMPLSELSN